MLNNKHVIRFTIIAIACYLLWFVVYDLWIYKLGSVDFWLTNQVAENVVSVMRVLGYAVFHQEHWTKHFIAGETGRILAISNACNGMVLYPLFAGFIIATPGRWIKKIIMICIGMLIIYWVNIIRVVILCLIEINAPQYLEFNHKYTFVILVYSVIFGLWVLWINKFSYIKADHK